MADLILSDDQIQNITVANIEEMLQSNGRSLREFSNMPFPLEQIVSAMQNRLIMEELNFDIEVLSNELCEYLQSITEKSLR